MSCVIEPCEYEPPEDDLARKEFLAQRQSGIGGSDLASILGVSPWSGPWAVYAEKKGLGAKAPTESMHWGTISEATIAVEWSRRTGKNTREVHRILRHPANAWNMMIANVDRVVDDSRVREGVEIKNVNAFCKGDWLRSGPPIQYQIQCQHYLAVTGYDVWHLVARFGGNELLAWRIEPDLAAIAKMWHDARDWWQRYIVGDDEPEADASPSCAEYLSQLYPRSDDECVAATKDDDDAMVTYVEAREQVKHWEEVAESSKNAIKKRLQAKESIRGTTYSARWQNTVPRKTVDVRRLREAYPEIYEKIVRKSAAQRRFTVQTIKENT